MFAKIVFGVTGSLTAYFTIFSLISPAYRRRLDHNVLRPIRNYRENLSDIYKLQTQEEFYEFLSDLGTGIGNMFTTADDQHIEPKPERR